MNQLMRFLIAAPLIASLTIISGVSNAAVTAISQTFSAKSTLSSAGFLDHKSILFSSVTGDNLDGVFNQIKFIGPELFQNAALRHGMLRKFKNSPGPLWSTSPGWRGDDSDRDVLNVEVYGKPSAASSELIDAILGDMTENYRNHGVSWMVTPTVGTETATYFNSATKKVFDLIEKLESAVSTAPVGRDNTAPTRPALTLSHLVAVFCFGMIMMVIGLLLWRRFPDKSEPPTTRADPAVCFEAIRHSPIRYAPKTL